MITFVTAAFVVHAGCVAIFVADAVINKNKQANYFSTLWSGAVATWAGFLLWGN